MQVNEILEALKKDFPEISLEEVSGALIIPRENLIDVCIKLKKGDFAFNSLHCLTAIDRKDRIEVVYVLHSLEKKHTLTLKVILDTVGPLVDSVVKLWKSADWFEREVFDLFGVTFAGHPDLRRILNPESWKDFPLRKDFTRPDFIKRPQT